MVSWQSKVDRASNPDRKTVISKFNSCLYTFVLLAIRRVRMKGQATKTLKRCLWTYASKGDPVYLAGRPAAPPTRVPMCAVRSMLPTLSLARPFGGTRDR
ncbi:hypothetical protein, partial [Candidatus Burkholderia verschuerenii]|uniref:hypothetical protein n=1 Tax=Candidatus Burkholderia verschuerenii TaxID=242163 RepID=UPI001E3185ED